MGAGFIQQTGLRRFINKSVEGVESIRQESPVGDHQANGDIESGGR